jgi:hypothetical protein
MSGYFYFFVALVMFLASRFDTTEAKRPDMLHEKLERETRGPLLILLYYGSDLSHRAYSSVTSSVFGNCCTGYSSNEVRPTMTGYDHQAMKEYAQYLESGVVDKNQVFDKGQTCAL